MEFRSGSRSGSRTSSFSKKQRMALDEESRLHQSLMSDFSSHMSFNSDERLKELKELRVIKRFQRKCKIFAYFFLFWACFILLNACIGFSSAPFYIPAAKCNKLEPNNDCSFLKSLSYAMYSFEMVGSLLLVIHGLLLIALVDHIKSVRLLQNIRRFSKASFILYIILIIMRIGVYFKVEDEIKGIDNDEADQSFGNFLASYVPDKQGAIALTFILILVFGICFIMNCLSIKLTWRIEAFVTKPTSGRNSALGINERTSSGRISSDSSDDERRKSSEGERKVSRLFFWKKK